MINTEVSEFMVRALNDACFGSEALDAVIPRYFDEKFSENVDGREVSGPEFTEQMQFIRSAAVSGSVEVIDSYADGLDFAHHHVITMNTADGASLGREVLMFGKRSADGRILRIVEQSRDIAAD